MEGNAEATVEPMIGLLEGLFSSLDQGFCLCEVIADSDGRPVDYRFLALNRRFAALTGLADATGRTAREVDPGIDPLWIETCGRVGFGREPVRFQHPLSSQGRWFDIAAAPYGKHGQFVAVFHDITEAKRLEEGRMEALARAEALLQELNHRVMNSLGMIVSIIGLESRAREEGEGRRALERIADRVHAVADLYRTLGLAGLEADVRADEYLGRVVNRLAASVSENVRTETVIAPIYLPTRVAAPLGLIVTELVTNCLKHAFPSGAGGTVQVSVAQEGARVRLTVADDGEGGSLDRPGGIGRNLVAAFAQQIEGEITVARTRPGTAVTLDFPLPDAPETKQGQT